MARDNAVQIDSSNNVVTLVSAIKYITYTICYPGVTPQTRFCPGAKRPILAFHCMTCRQYRVFATLFIDMSPVTTYPLQVSQKWGN